MSNSDPQLPSSADPEDADESLADVVDDERPPFRTPTPGDSLSPEDLQADR